MKLKHKNMGKIIRFMLVIALTSFLNTGCADNAQDISVSGLETENTSSSVFESESSNAEIFNMEPSASDVSEEDVPIGDVHLFEQGDKISTMFYDLQLDKVTVTDSIGDVTAESGREFLILDVTVTAGDTETVTSMYAQEFLMVCFVGDSLKSDSEEDYEKLYPLEAGLAQGQLDDAWLAMTGEDQKGKLIYNVPKDTVRTVLLVYDCYRTGELNEVVYGDGYMMTILKENWSRED